MRFVYLVKLGLKSALIIAITTSILVSLHGLPERDKREYGEQFEGSTGSLVNLPDSLNEIDVQKKVKPEVDFEDEVLKGEYAKESYVYYNQSGEIHREKGDVWESLDTNSKFTLRYWELVEPDNRKKDSHRSFESRRVIQQGDDVPNLWRPPFSSFSREESNRIIPQLVWGMEAPTSSLSGRKKNKKIVVGDSFKWWSKDWPSGHHQLSQRDCKRTPGIETRCVFYDSLHEIGDADAVITPRDSFHSSALDVPPGVLKFYFILESPFHSWVLLNRSEDLLATYWRESDLVTPYAAWAYYDNSFKSQVQERDYSVGKTKPGAIFVSNCGSWNGRMNYIRELQKYVDIDVYGNCGTLNCEKNRGKDCFKLLKKDYYFYFSFENSNCRDYITEKLFQNGLENDVIPIVLGAHPKDYKAMAPQNSYLHVEDFKSQEELAKRMKFLMANPKEYNKYFEWKGTGEFITSDLFCRLCAMVHYADIVPPPKRTQPYRWGHTHAIKSGMCLPANRWYWEREN